MKYLNLPISSSDKMIEDVGKIIKQTIETDQHVSVEIPIGKTLTSDASVAHVIQTLDGSIECWHDMKPIESFSKTRVILRFRKLKEWEINKEKEGRSKVAKTILSDSDYLPPGSEHLFHQESCGHFVPNDHTGPCPICEWINVK